MDASNAVYYANRAAAYLGKDSFEAARDDCVKSLEIDPTYAKASIRLALALEKMGNLQDAYDALQKSMVHASKKDKKGSAFREMKKMSQKIKAKLGASSESAEKSSRAALSQAMLSSDAATEVRELEAKAKKANMNARKCAHEQQQKVMDAKRNMLTLKHFEMVPADTNVFNSVGKAFFKTTPAGVKSHLQAANVRLDDEVGTLKKQKMYWERVSRDAKANIDDIVRRAR